MWNGEGSQVTWGLGGQGVSIGVYTEGGFGHSDIIYLTSYSGHCVVKTVEAWVGARRPVHREHLKMCW